MAPVDVVAVGRVVTVFDGTEEESWQIVPAQEADAARGLISEACPLARAVLGQPVGSRVRVERPGGVCPVTIRGIR